MLALYTITLFLSATLLFLVQPMFTKVVLPMLGGSPAVWNTSVVFYQIVLLLGYLYAHLTTTRLGVRRQSTLHMFVMFLPLLMLPIGVPAGWIPPVEGHLALWLLSLLTVAVGLPFFVVSTTSPLLQAWFAATGHPSAKDPYFLYAASNVGSLAALLGYPLLVEPYVQLEVQSRAWAVGYGLLMILLAGCAVLLWRSQRSAAHQLTGRDDMDNAQSLASRPGRPTSRRRLHWIILAFVPSSLMLGFTTYLSTSIPPIPLLWVIPLSIYLLTFILVFATRPIIPHTLMVRVFPMILLPAVLIIIAQATQPIWLLVLFQLVTFFVVAMVCHGILAATRPAPAYLTEFYLWMSLGGVLGGAFNSLVAPVLFNSVLELPLVLSIACLLLPKAAAATDKRSSWWLDMSLPAALGALTVGLIFTMQAAGLEQSQLRLALGFGIPAIICFSFSRRPLRFALAVGMLFLASSFYTVEEQGRLLYSDRSFFGIHRVFLDRSGQYHLLVHGATVHGKQSLDPSRRREPLTYYHPQGPIGQVFAALNSDATRQRIAVVGLGAGSVACYSRPGQEWTFYEIDPVVERIARDPRLFSFLQECNPEAQIVLGDARLSLARAPDHFYDLIILDAYNSDSIPIHLMTREALALYRAKLAPGGMMAFHISNQYLDLHPVLSTLAQDAGLAYLIQNDTIFDHKLAMQGKDGSIWALVARSPADFGILSNDPRWMPLSGPPGTPVWTDNFSSIFSVLRWH